jgi:hypothetical protein
MERPEAIINIKKIVGQDLRELASNYNVTVFKDGKKIKVGLDMLLKDI